MDERIPIALDSISIVHGSILGSVPSSLIAAPGEQGWDSAQHDHEIPARASPAGAVQGKGYVLGVAGVGASRDLPQPGHSRGTAKRITGARPWRATSARTIWRGSTELTAPRSTFQSWGQLVEGCLAQHPTTGVIRGSRRPHR